MDDSMSFRSGGVTCTRTRLAETDVAAVDGCDCGLIHLHLGPFSLRMTPTSLNGLLDTLARAVGATVTRPGAARAATTASSALRRGDA